MKNMSDDEFVKFVSHFLQKKDLDKNKIIILNDYLSDAFSLNRKELIIFLIDHLEKVRKKNQDKNLIKELTSREYKSLNFKNKVEYWSGNLHGIMRNQVESCLDEYAIFTVEWYKIVKEYEPEFDNIMNTVFAENWRGHWDKNEYLKRVDK